MTQWVYTFGDGKAEGEAGMKNLLGGKGANLAEMSNLGLPVPPGFTITTEVCTYYYDHGHTYPTELTGAGRRRRSPMSADRPARTFGDAENPLLVSVRSGARASMPGMMDTVLNLGLNDDTVEALARAARATSASPMTATAASSPCTRTSCSASSTTISRRPSTTYKDRKGYTLDTDLTADDWKTLIGALQDASSRRSSASRSRRIRRSSSGARSAPCSAPG